MIIYHATKRQFLNDVSGDTIADNIDNAFFAHLGRHTSPNEKRSWENSMQYMYHVMNTAELPDETGVAIEYQIPLTSKRINFIVCGNSAEGKENIVIMIIMMIRGSLYELITTVLQRVCNGFSTLFQLAFSGALW